MPTGRRARPPQRDVLHEHLFAARISPKWAAAIAAEARMTTLEERVRSLDQARELLEDVIVERCVPDDIRSVAADALLHYPSHADAPRLATETDPDQVQAWGRALAQTRWVIERAPVSLGHAHPLSHHALVANRHFPEASYLLGTDSQHWQALFVEPLQLLLGFHEWSAKPVAR